MAQPAAQSPDSPPLPSGLGSDYGWFIASVTTWFGAWGMQAVLFAWLVVGELHGDAKQVSLAQTCLMVPGLLFLMFGGATADRRDRRRMLILLQGFGATLVLMLAGAIATGQLSFPILIAYALCMGTAQAFIMPARDSLLSDVAGHDLMRAVTGLTMAQFTSQALGSLLGGSARWLGSASTLALQGGLLLAGLAPLWLLRTSPHPSPGHARSTTLSDIRDGLREVWGSDRLRPLVLLVMGNGVLFLGPFLVTFPLLVRDVYQGDVADLAVVNMSFSVGTILGSAALLWRRGIRRKGRALLLAMLFGGACLAAIAFALPFRGLLALVIAWGICGSAFFNASRTLVQEAAPVTHRARVLSLYSLALLGSAPFGAFVSGLATETLGPLATCGVAGVAMIILIGLVWTMSDIRHMR